MSIGVTGNERIDTATAEIAVEVRNANPGWLDQRCYDRAAQLRDEILDGVRAAAVADRARLVAIMSELNRRHTFDEALELCTELLAIYDRNTGLR